MENTALFVAFALLLTFAEVMSNEPNVPNCPKVYQRFSPSHTYCQPQNRTCRIQARKVSDTEADDIVQFHNNYRSNIATQGKDSYGLPAASYMMKMEWDKELAAVAQKTTDRCVYEHDDGDERRVRNFGVGQNLAKQQISGVAEKPEPDWEWAVKAWYDEIEFFEEEMICGSRKAATEEEEVEHFTQVIWAKSFRVGCGYTLYKEGDTYISLYACNYGPGGNVDNTCVYKEGKVCSNCPANTACEKSGKNRGLCKRTSDQAPYFPIKQPTLFECNFRDPQSEDCRFHRAGVDKWHLVPALSGQYLETTLTSGQTATLVFEKSIAGAAPEEKICVQIRYRKGPDLAKDKQNIASEAIFVIPSYDDFTSPLKLPTNSGKFILKFSSYSMKLGWIAPTKMKLSVTVPNGARPQFLEVQYIAAFNGPTCPSLEDF